MKYEEVMKRYEELNMKIFYLNNSSKISRLSLNVLHIEKLALVVKSNPIQLDYSIKVNQNLSEMSSKN